MKTVHLNDKSSRCWAIAEIPAEDPRDLTELEIFANYTGEGSAAKGIPLDTYVVPLFKLAPRLLDVVSGMLDTVDMGFSAAEIKELHRLSDTVSRRDKYQVVVGNIGTVYSGNLLKEALASYKEYKQQSKTGYGRAASEQVTLFKDNEPWREHEGRGES